jgi:hypothetical protein
LVDDSLADNAAELTEVLRLEVRLLSDLLRIIERQRQAALAEELHAVEETIYDTHRVLHTLNEAKRRRTPISRRLGITGGLVLRKVETELRERMPEELRSIAKDLERLAGVLANEIEINRAVLRQTLAAQSVA